ncbi:unnamed protein product [Musa textilis]
MDVDFKGRWACPVLWTCTALPMALPPLNLGEPAALSSVRGSFQMIKMIGRKGGLPLLQLLALLLLLSCLAHPLGAVPAHIGSLSFGSEDTSVLEDTDQVTSREMRMMEEEISKMEIASNDYPGSGANNRHDPKSPGRV